MPILDDLWLSVTGDIMLDHPLVDSSPGGPRRATQDAYDLLRQADLSFVNLEVPLSDRGTSASKLITMRADPSLAHELPKIGCKVASIANNHALDYGPEGLLQTLESLAAVGVLAVGGGADLDSALVPAVVSANGLRVAFLAFATTLPHGFAARQGSPGIAPIKIFTSYVVDTEALDEVPGMSPYAHTEAWQTDVDRACGTIRQSLAQADLIVVGMHWGIPHGWIVGYQAPLATYQRQLAHALIDAGTRAIIGHNAHMLHGMEYYRGRPILYSLGDFVFHTHASGRPLHLRRNFPPYNPAVLRSQLGRLSCVVRLHISAAGVDAVEIVPIVLNDLGEPEVADAVRAEEILTMLDEQSTPLGVRIDRVGGRGRLVKSEPGP